MFHTLLCTALNVSRNGLEVANLDVKVVDVFQAYIAKSVQSISWQPRRGSDDPEYSDSVFFPCGLHPVGYPKQGVLGVFRRVLRFFKVVRRSVKVV